MTSIHLLASPLLCAMAVFSGSQFLAAQEHSEKPVNQSAAPQRTLTASQKAAMEAIKTEAEKKAAPHALHLAEVVKRIYENMLADQPDVELDTKLSNELKNTAWELLAIKGQSIRDTVRLLDPEQKNALRAEMAKPGAPSDLTEVIGHLF